MHGGPCGTRLVPPDGGSILRRDTAIAVSSHCCASRLSVCLSVLRAPDASEWRSLPLALAAVLAMPRLLLHLPHRAGAALVEVLTLVRIAPCADRVDGCGAPRPGSVRAAARGGHDVAGAGGGARGCGGAARACGWRGASDVAVWAPVARRWRSIDKPNLVERRTRSLPSRRRRSGATACGEQVQGLPAKYARAPQGPAHRCDRTSEHACLQVFSFRRSRA